MEGGDVYHITVHHFMAFSVTFQKKYILVWTHATGKHVSVGEGGSNLPFRTSMVDQPPCKHCKRFTVITKFLIIAPNPFVLSSVTPLKDPEMFPRCSVPLATLVSSPPPSASAYLQERRVGGAGSGGRDVRGTCHRF